VNVIARKCRDEVLVRLPMRLVNGLNAREHWGARKRRAASQRGPVALSMRPHLLTLPAPWAIQITRIGPRRMDSDGLAAACKHVRDGVADALGIDDGDERATWLYAQRTAKQGGDTWVIRGYGVEVAVWTHRGAEVAARAG
jgi:hypothetical protein